MNLPPVIRSLATSVWLRVTRLFDEDNRAATLLFFAALVLYALGLTWGLPHATAANRVLGWGPDEIAPFGFGEPYFALKGDAARIDPRYPLFHYVVQVVACGPYLAWLVVSNQWTGFSRAFPYGLVDPVTALRNLAFLGRLPSLLMGAGVVAVACKTRPFAHGDRRLDVLSGLFVLSLTPMFYYSSTSNVDVPALFWTALGLAVVARALDTGFTLRRAVWIGLLAALAAGTKDAYYTVFAGVLPALFVLHVRGRRAEGASWRDALRAPSVCIAVGAVAYAVSSGLVVNVTRYLRHVKFILHGSPVSAIRGHYGSVPPTLEGYLHTVRATVDEAANSMGVLGLALALVGLGICARRDRRSLVFALPAVTLFALVILPVRFVEIRFLLPMVYVLAFFAAYAIWSAWTSSSSMLRTLGTVACVVSLSLQGVKAANLEYERFFDQRYTLAAWFVENVRPGERVAAIDGAYKFPPLPKEIVNVETPLGDAAEHFFETERPEFIAVIPKTPHNPVHEAFLPEQVYQRLRDGSLGYVQVLGVRGPNLVPLYRFATVNPPVKVFVRSDLRSRIPEQAVRIDIAD